MAHPQLKLEQFKAPEGQYIFHSELPSRAPFSTSRACRLTYAELSSEAQLAAAAAAAGGGRGTPPGGGAYFLHNVLEFLYISEYTNPDREPVRSVCCGSGSGSAPTWPTCHAHAPTPDGLDLIIGLSSGDVLVTSLAGQVAAQRGDSHRAACHHFNPAADAGGGSNSDRNSDRSGGGSERGGGGSGRDGSRVAGVCWLSAAQGLFAAGHASGNLFIYQKRGGDREGGRVATQLRSIVSVAGSEPIAAIRTGSPISGVAASPDGGFVAVSCADGVLRIYSVATQRLTGGFKSYYGGLLCCAWSPDGRFIAAGGEDDLVALYSLEARCCVAWGAGHHSWVAGVAFDTWAYEGQEVDGLVRLLSCGHDGQLALWDFDTSPEALTPVSPRLGSGAAPSAARRLFGAPPDRQNGIAGGGAAAEGAVAPAPQHADMDLQAPVRLRKLYNEPVSAVLPTPGAIFLASFSGAVRCWRRPPPPPPPPPVPRPDPQPNAQPVQSDAESMDADLPAGIVNGPAA